MPRRPREWIEGAVYHLFAGGSNRQAIFLNEGDCIEFDALLHETAICHRLDTFGWSLMQNHGRQRSRKQAGRLASAHFDPASRDEASSASRMPLLKDPG